MARAHKPLREPRDHEEHCCRRVYTSGEHAHTQTAKITVVSLNDRHIDQPSRRSHDEGGVQVISTQLWVVSMDDPEWNWNEGTKEVRQPDPLVALARGEELFRKPAPGDGL